ncbi:MAG: DNA polymerase III subunit delta [Pseudomonadota bacterium]
MVAIKAQEADALFAGRTPRKSNACLIYGPDRGLVAERARAFLKASGVALDDPFSYIALQGQDLVGENAGRLMDEVSTIAMFGGGRAVHVSDPPKDAGFVDAVKAALAALDDQTYLLIETGDLKKSAALRTVFEKSKSALAVPCYADDTRSLQGLINQMIQDAGKTVALDARELLVANLGGDRGTSRREIEKLLLYCAEHDRVEAQHVTDVIGDTSTIAIDQIIDGLLVGELNQCETGLSRLEASGMSPAVLINGLSRQFQQLDAMRAAMSAQRTSARSVVENARPPIFFRRKPVVTKALDIWSGDMIRSALTRLRETTVSSRTAGALETAHIRMLVLALGQRAYLATRR